MHIPDEAVQAARKRIDEYYDTPNCVGEAAVRAALVAALPFLQGVKVKALDWIKPPLSETLSRCETEFGTYRTWTHDEANGKWFWSVEGGYNEVTGEATDEAAAKAAAQADYEARILSAIEPAPPPRAQALEALKRTPAIEALTPTTDEWLRCETIQDTYDLMKRRVDRVIHVLSSQPVADGWLPIEKEPDNQQGPFLVTNNPKALNAFGRPSHVWCVSGIYKEKDGSFCAFEGTQKLHGLVMFMPVSAPLPASPGASE